MKALTLYIDKWYIIGAVCTDGVPRLIKPKTGENCFWLFFYEDLANDEIVYGKDNKQHFYNNEVHYYGDVFSLITKNGTTFTRYGREQSIDKIFKASGLLDELKAAVAQDEGKIETYISFSKDISDAARLIFMRDVLAPDNFDVKESVARIGHLALEHAYRNNLFSEEGYYLLLNACNENLLYSLYEYKDNLFLRKAESSLNGMGTDLRSRAILENVVKSINLRNSFLKTEEDFDREYARLAQFVDNWILRLERAKPGRPVTIPNVSFAGMSNTYQATLLKDKIDARTSAIVDDIFREIVTFVRNTGVTNDKIKGVLLLGNTFTNSQFLTEIKEQYTLSDEKYVHYKSTDLPNIVAVYTVMDCSQFSVATLKSEKQGEAEIERQKIAQEEAEKKRKAEEEHKKQEEQYRAAHEADRKYEEAMRNVFDYEKKQDYAQMADWAGIALSHHPNDAEALKKKNDATRLLSEQKVREEQYRGIIARAQKSFKAGQWQDALAQSDAALNLKPDSAEAKRIYNESKKKIESAAEVEKFLTRADLFLAQKSYAEALLELKKVQSYDPENGEAKKRISDIEAIRKGHEEKIASLISNYEEAKKKLDYKTAISACEQLADLDSVNQKKWTAETEKLRASEENYQRELKRFEELKRKAMDADFREEWGEFIHFAEEAIQIKKDEDLLFRISKAKIKLKEIQEKEQYQNGLNQINKLVLDKEFEEAETILNQLQKVFPEHKDDLKAVRKKLFSQEFNKVNKEEPKKEPRRPIGFHPEQKKVDLDDFFGDDNKTKKQPQKATPAPNKKEKPSDSPKKKTEGPKTGIDFFDMDFKPTPKAKGDSPSHSDIDNNFNF